MRIGTPLLHSSLSIKRFGDARAQSKGSAIKPETHTLTQLFGGPVRYIVPLYQRPYVWQEKTHWQPLWLDVATVAEHQLEGTGSALTHFLGAVVLEQEQTPPGEVPRHLVIDGQQRITTLQLLLDAVADEAEADGADRDARILRHLVENDPDLAEGTARYKVWPTNANRADFEIAMGRAARVAGVPTQSVDTNIIDAHEYFRRASRSWAHDAREDARAARYAALRIALTDLLQVVSINLETGDNAQVIFETLNARGTPLLAMDLVKNAVFRMAEVEFPEAVDALHNDVWEPELGQPRWRKEQRQGRLKRPRAELFLMHWLTMRLVEPVPATELFSTFRGKVLLDEGRPAIDALTVELCRDARTMRSFDEFGAETAEGRFFERLTALDTTTVLPVVLALFTSGTVGSDQRVRALAALESWLVRRMICGLTTKNYNNLAVELLRVMDAHAETVDEALIAHMDDWDQPTTRWPRDNELRQTLRSRGIYGWVAQRRLVMVLSAIEHARRVSNKTEAMLDPASKLTVEHVLPQNWEENWPLPPSDELTVEEQAATRNGLVHSLGNLTLTTGPMNSSLSNSAWAKKRIALPQHSLLLLNSDLAKRERWTEDEIRQRTESMTAEIISIWGPPPTERPLPTNGTVQGERKTYSWTLADLLAAGKLIAGEQLRPRGQKYTTPALVTDDGQLVVAGARYGSPSPAAQAVSGNSSEPGWRFWGAERHGVLVELAELRAELGEPDDA